MKPPKQCDEPGCTAPVFGGGKCKWPAHQRKRTDAAYLRKKAKRDEMPQKAPTKIKPLSEKRAAQYRQYYKQRKVFLAKPENRMCRKYPKRKATTVHHAMGKIDELLLDERYWIPLCLEAHQWAEGNPNAAKDLCLSFDRLS